VTLSQGAVQREDLSVNLENKQQNELSGPFVNHNEARTPPQQTTTVDCRQQNLLSLELRNTTSLRGLCSYLIDSRNSWRLRHETQPKKTPKSREKTDGKSEYCY
jgi:flagellar basal body P-ring protein FlgI